MHISDQTIKFGLHGLTLYGQTYSYQVRPQDVGSDPYWNPETEPPPLAIDVALKIAQIGLKKYVRPEEAWHIRKIDLHQIEYGKWIYVFGFVTEHQIEQGQRPQSFFIVVKMDGTVIEPILDQ